MSSTTNIETNARLAPPTRLLVTYMEEAASKLAKRREIVGERIRAAREAKGWLQKELAGRVHVEPQTVSNWERGVTTPDLDTLDKVARELGITVASLLVDPRSGEAAQEQDLRVLLARAIELLEALVPPEPPGRTVKPSRRRAA